MPLVASRRVAIFVLWYLACRVCEVCMLGGYIEPFISGDTFDIYAAHSEYILDILHTQCTYRIRACTPYTSGIHNVHVVYAIYSACTILGGYIDDNKENPHRRTNYRFAYFKHVYGRHFWWANVHDKPLIRYHKLVNITYHATSENVILIWYLRDYIAISFTGKMIYIRAWFGYKSWLTPVFRFTAHVSGKCTRLHRADYSFTID